MSEERFDHVADIYERMYNDARRHHVDLKALDVTTTDGLEAAREAVNNFISLGHTTAAELSRRTGVKPSVISAFRNDRWKGKAGTQATVATDLAKAIDRIGRELEAEETRLQGFVKTRVAEAIYTVVQYAIKRRLIGVLVIPAGCGETITLTQIARETPGAVLITARKCRASTKSFLQLWARALGLPENGRAEDIQDRIIDFLTGSFRLVLIDEAQKLQVGTLDVIREVWDAAKMPVVLSGTPVFYQTLSSKNVGEYARELMDQLFSRVGIFRDLTTLAEPGSGDDDVLVNARDIQELFSRGRVRLLKDGVDFLFKLANTPGAGGLRVCADLVQKVIDLYPDESISAALLEHALKTQVGAREAGFRMDHADLKPSTRVAVG